MAKRSGPETPEILRKRLIKGAIRRIFRQSDEFKFVITQARVELPPALKKDGQPGKRPQVRFRCASCSELHPQKWINVDHIIPVIYLHESEEETTIADMIDRIWCSKENLQVLCSTPMKFLKKGEKSCHAMKTLLENFIRDKWKIFKTNRGGHGIIDKEVISQNESLWTREFEEIQVKQKQIILDKESRKLARLKALESRIVNKLKRK